MHREVIEELVDWKESADRMPLILEGVRQCGKTYILKEFGKAFYEDVAYFNFEEDPRIHPLFDGVLDPARIIKELGLVREKKIEPGKTLVIFDEIQDCGRALTSMKYFCEKSPEYHIAAAGSLLGVRMSKPHSFPVGKVDKIRMGPMNFKEFLIASGREMTVGNIAAGGEVSEPIADMLWDILKTYLVVGGMPRAVSTWIRTGDIAAVEKIQDSILNEYEMDFSKYAEAEHSKLSAIWSSIPAQLSKDNSKFMFGHVRTGGRSRDLEDALWWLVNAGLVHKVDLAERPEVPIFINADASHFKLYMSDAGLLRRMAGIPPGFTFVDGKDNGLYRGMAAENFVMCELASYGLKPCYWRSGGRAEVDFIIQSGSDVIPIEVKAGNSSHSKSLSEYILRYSPKTAVITSMERAEKSDARSVPMYELWSFLQGLQR
ncbi:MAG: ATP-binding protein [Candidatus Methanoplasma sp.]|jgi:predicted AAA+ superfamily ATPase|nr:ATP-binding protein [Candidatus Methanoplasma sp.]